MFGHFYLTCAGKIEDRLIQNLKEKLFRCSEKKKVVFLVGDLGSGKTYLVRRLIHDGVSSPTFSLRNEYEINAIDGCKTVAHWDLYRVSSLPAEIFLEQADLVFIEWANRFDQIYRGLQGDLIIFITDDHNAFVYERGKKSQENHQCDP